MELIAEEYIHEVLPSPGTQDKTWEEIEKKLEVLKGIAKSVHIDIVDGKFAPNTTFMDPAPFSKFKDDFLLEVHLMTDNPLQYLKPFADAGFTRFIGQVEKMPDISEFVAEAQLYGEVGLSLDGGTNISALGDVSLDDLDCLTVMTIQAGFSGQEFVESHLEKVKKLREMTMLPIEVDGGIKDTTILFAKNAGATRFVASSFIWGSDDSKAAFEKLQEIIKPS